MFCKIGLSWNAKLQRYLIILGTVTAALGIALLFVLKDTAGYNLGLFCGMITGIGAAAVISGILHLLRIRKMSPEELERKIRQSNDERNQAIVGRAMRRTVLIVGIAAFAAALTAALLNHVDITFALIAAVYLILITFACSYRHFDRVM